MDEKTLMETFTNLISKMIESSNVTTSYSGIVTDVSTDNKLLTVILPGYNESKFNFLNKSGELVNIGDSVLIDVPQNNFTNAFVSKRFGVNNGYTGNLSIGGFNLRIVNGIIISI